MTTDPTVPRPVASNLMLRLGGFGLLGFCLATVTIMALIRAFGALFR